MVGFARVDNGRQDAAVIQILVVIFEMRVQKLVQNVRIRLGQPLAHKAARVFRSRHTAGVDQAVQRRAVKGGKIRLTRFELRQLLRRIVNERGKLGALLFGNGCAEHAVGFLPDDAGGVAENVRERVRLAVQIAHEMFRRLRQLQNGLQVDDLGRRCRARRIFLREEREEFVLGTGRLQTGTSLLKMNVVNIVPYSLRM